MASIEKRGKVYVVRWRNLGQSYNKTFKTKAQADEWRRQIEGDVAAGTAVNPRDSRITLAAWHKEWSPTRVHLRLTTQARNRHLGNKYLDRFGAARLDQITTADVQAWVTELGEAGQSVAEVYGELGKCLQAAVVARKLRANPCAGVNLPQRPKKEMQIIDRQQIKALADELGDEYRAFIYFLAYSGLRVSEAAAITPADIDLVRSEVRVNKQLQEVAGVLIEQVPKSKAGIRTVPVPPTVLAMLDLTGERVFTTDRGSNIRVNVFRQRKFMPAVKSLGIALRIHDLRHTAISMWIDHGYDLVKIKTWAGHERATFTIDQYGHLFKTDNSAIIAQMDAAVV